MTLLLGVALSEHECVYKCTETSYNTNTSLTRHTKTQADVFAVKMKVVTTTAQK